MLKSLKHYFGKRYHLALYLRNEFNFLLRTLGSCDTCESQNKQRELIIMQTHVIEKGLSLKNIRLGFGIPKILNLLTQLRDYNWRYNDKETLKFSLSVINAYIEFHKKEKVDVNPAIVNLFNELMKEMSTDNEKLKGGTIHLTKTEVVQATTARFEIFAKSRHSLRQFTGEPIDITILEKAFEIAETTPSACNRQPWHNYVFTKKENIIKVLDIQNGARQFKNDVAALIVVCATPNAFYGNEYHQHYVNGGLYAMNLLYALHSQGLGAIPLNGGISKEQTNQILSICEGSSQDELIMLIAVGHMPMEFNVAKSARFSFASYTKFD